MVEREVYSLQWRHFQSYLNETFLELRSDNDFCDVTLVSEDNEQIEAHKVILSSCSPFFQQILMKNKHSHPLLYMRGISSTMLFYIVDFVYKGETKLLQDELDSFLKIAQEFSLKGLDKFPNKSESLEAENKMNNLDINNIITDKAHIKPKNNTPPISESTLEKEQPYKIDDEDLSNLFTDKTGIEPSNNAMPMVDLKLQEGQLNRMKLQYNQELTYQSNTEETRMTIKSLLFKRFENLRNGKAKCNICNIDVSALCYSSATGHLQKEHKEEYALFQREKSIFESSDNKNKTNYEDIDNVITDKTCIEPMNHTIPSMSDYIEETRVTIKSLILKRFQMLKNKRAKCNICNKEVSASRIIGVQGHLKSKHKEEYATFLIEKNMFWKEDWPRGVRSKKSCISD